MALGVAAACDLTPPIDRLTFGSLNCATNLGFMHTARPLAHVRAEHVLASRLAGLSGPVDEVTADTGGLDLIRQEANLGVELGFKGTI
ncbi:MAG: hypothetical protein JJ897_18015 [Marinibacterium sp.]|nr:hypothetical protein [Marinibacterium sp.]